MKMISPILQQTQLHLVGSAASASAERNAFRNMDRRPWLIDEIRFVDLDTAGVTYEDGYGGFVGSRIRVCGLDVTAEYVPLWSLDPYQNPRYLRDQNTYCYRPARPIILPSGECLAVDLAADVIAMNNLDVDPMDNTVSVSICGRPADPDELPPTIDVPWVAKWQPLFGQAGGNKQSTQDDLVNPFDVPLSVDRLVGNVAIGGNGAGYSDASLNHPDVTEFMLSLQLNDTRGGVIVRDPAPFGHVFSAIDRLWRTRTILPSSAYLLMSLDLQQWVPVEEEVGDAIYVNVAMHGTRKVLREDYHG